MQRDPVNREPAGRLPWDQDRCEAFLGRAWAVRSVGGVRRHPVRQQFACARLSLDPVSALRGRAVRPYHALRDRPAGYLGVWRPSSSTIPREMPGKLMLPSTGTRRVRLLVVADREDLVNQPRGLPPRGQVVQ